MLQNLELFPAPSLACGKLYYVLHVKVFMHGKTVKIIYYMYYMRKCKTVQPSVWVMFSVQFPVLRNCRTLDHPTHSPDLTPSDYQPFVTLKQNLGGNRFEDDGEVKTEVA